MEQNAIPHRIVTGIVSAPESEAAGLAEKLVKERLAACAQVTEGITSFYHWDGKIQRDREVLIIFKTKMSLQQEAADFIQREHSYDVPECVFLPVYGGIGAYLQWVGEETK